MEFNPWPSVIFATTTAQQCSMEICYTYYVTKMSATKWMEQRSYLGGNGGLVLGSNETSASSISA